MKDEVKLIMSVMLLVLGLCIAILIGAIKLSKESSNSSPVENDSIIAAAQARNDSLTILVNNLDSIKNAKIIEVRSLDNDSTLKLFYKLVAE